MALTVPSQTDLEDFWGDTYPTELTVDRANMLLDLSTNLMWLGTSLEADPTDARLASLVKYGIMDMAIYMYIYREELDAVYSPFSSERVGSYSYSKMLKSVQQGIDTGVQIFDRVVAYYRDLAMAACGGWTSSESVFRNGYIPLAVEAFFLSTVWSAARGGGWIQWDDLMSPLSDQRFINDPNAVDPPM
jgi:hypothetical protein